MIRRVFDHFEIEQKKENERVGEGKNEEGGRVLFIPFLYTTACAIPPELLQSRYSLLVSVLQPFAPKTSFRFVLFRFQP